MRLEESIVKSIRDAAGQVCSTMLGIDIGPGEASIERGAPMDNEGVVSLIGLGGEWAGMGSLNCSPALACQLCSRMLMADCAAVNEEVLDAVAELTNMIIGSVKTDLETEVGPLALSIPTVIYGRNFKTKSARNTEWAVLQFRLGEERLLVRLCLAPQEASAHDPCHAPGQACALEVS